MIQVRIDQHRMWTEAVRSSIHAGRRRHDITHTRVPPATAAEAAAQLMERPGRGAGPGGRSIPACSYAKAYLGEASPRGEGCAGDRQAAHRRSNWMKPRRSFPASDSPPWREQLAGTSGVLRAPPAGRACRSRALLPPVKIPSIMARLPGSSFRKADEARGSDPRRYVRQ